MIKIPKKAKISIISLSVFFVMIFVFATIFRGTFSEHVTSSRIWDGSIANSFSGGNGSTDNPFLIEDGRELAYLKELLEGPEANLYLDKYYFLTDNINLGNHEFYIANEEPFKGTINGNANTISNHTIINSLFLTTYEATIKNINFDNIILQNTEEHIAGMLVSVSEKSLFENITVFATYEVNADNFVGSFIGVDKESTLRNVVLNANYKINDDSFLSGGHNLSEAIAELDRIALINENVSLILHDGTNTVLENVLVKESEIITNLFNINNDIEENNIIEYTTDKEKIIIENKDTAKVLESLIDSEDYKFIVEGSQILFSEIEEELIIEEATGALSPSTVFELNNSGIIGNTLYINDLEADWNYFYGLNYTEVNGALPSGINQNIYNETNLVRVQKTYSGTDPIGNLAGFVSTTERQSVYVYYKYYHVVNGQIIIPLIDNPFADRPANKGFNNWVASGTGHITFDSRAYKRYLEIDVSFTNGRPDDLVIDLHASWVNARVQVMGSANPAAATWQAHINILRQRGMVPVYVGTDIDMGSQPLQYFLQVYISSGQSTAGLYTVGFALQGPTATCGTAAGCTLFQLILPGTIYDPGIQYFRRTATTGGTQITAVNAANEITFPPGISPDFDGKSMTGYFREIRVNNGQSQAGFYNAVGERLTGNCTTGAGCVVFELIQSSMNHTATLDVAYRFLVTRDTNFLVLRNNANTAWTTAHQGTAFATARPFTFTSVYNGIDSRNFLWNPPAAAIQIGTDTTFENMQISASVTAIADADPSGTTAVTRTIYGNYNNLKMGRGITRSGANFTFVNAMCGNPAGGAQGTAATPRKFSCLIESGYYNVIGAVVHGGTGAIYIDPHIVYGNDYDRITNNNNNLTIATRTFGSNGGVIRNSTSDTDSATVLRVTVKSGSFGTARTNAFTGIYVNGRAGTPFRSAASLKIEGGWVYSTIGGLGTLVARRDINDIFIHMTGGSVDNIFGGAGVTATFSNRIISVIGGVVNYNVFGGSNGALGTGAADGTLDGSSFVYVGGNAQIGNAALVENNTTLFGADAGNIFGIGNGRAGTASVGTNKHSRVIIDGNAHILRNVYGGGNFSATGAVSNETTTSTNITILGGRVDGDVYGAGNRNGSGLTTRLSTITLNMHDGLVNGSIYGGANISGTVHGSVNLNILNGEVGSNIYGGGRGGTGSTGNFVSQNVNVNIGSSDTAPLIRGSVYGGSAFGSVNGTANNITVTNFTTNVTVDNGIIYQSVFGGGEGNATFIPWTLGHLTVNINGGNIGRVFAGSDQNGTPNGNSPVYLNGGIIGEAYGGGNAAPVRNSQIFLRGAQVTSIYGGSNTAGTVQTSNVFINSGTVTNIYGGNNLGGTTINSNVTIDGATINGIVYGGGNQASGTLARINLLASENRIPAIYGGAFSANQSETEILINGIQARDIFGGSNITGTVNISNINMENGEIGDIHGGNNQGGQTINAYIHANGGEVENIFGGGKATNATETNIFLNGSIVENVFGGSDVSGTVANTNIIATSGNINNILGGNNLGGISQNTNVIINGGYINRIYGGGYLTYTNNTNIELNNNSNTIENIFGGGNEGGANNARVNINGGNSKNVFGGSNIRGEVTTSNVNVSNGTIEVVYGGNNQGGETGSANVLITGGTIKDAYGGGNRAITNTTNIRTDNATLTGDIYGGGNQAGVTLGTNVRIINSTIQGDVYGGGNLGAVGTNAHVYFSNSTCHSSVHGGGNGATAIVFGNTLLNIDGNSNITGNVFGGGNAAATGTEGISNARSIVNIVGGNITGDVYGGGNTTVIHGSTELNIGYNAANNSDLIMGNVNITGTVFGGGRANIAGDENYDFSFISVTRGLNILIDGSSHNNFSISGSIFGSGNASTTIGTSIVEIKNYGTANSVRRNISIQRATTVILDNTHILLTGARDRTNEFSHVIFSISRVEELKIQNNSTIYLGSGTNLVQKINSTVDGTIKAAVNIEDGVVTKNVDNRIYAREGVNINIATNENITAFGEISGMTFFGMFELSAYNVIITAIYDRNYNSGDLLQADAHFFTKGSYILARHLYNHDITVDGFYSNFIDETNPSRMIQEYVEPTPEDAPYYMWSIGEAVSIIEISLMASRYTTLGTYELPLLNLHQPNSTLSIIGFNHGYLDPNVSLVAANEIRRVAETSEIADNVMGLSMETSHTGWTNIAQTEFRTDTQGIHGSRDYLKENSNVVPSLLFYLNHSKNIETEGEMGKVVISIIIATPIDALNYNIERINIEVSLFRAFYQDNAYEASLTPGKQHRLFVPTSVDITTSSSFSAYFSLYALSEIPFYNPGYHRALVSNFVFPANTKITMLDLSREGENPDYYYYIITPQDVINAQAEFNTYGEVSYKLSQFIEMGSTSSTAGYNEQVKNNEYWDSINGYTEEKFIFHIDFAEANIQSDVRNASLVFELRNASGHTIVNILSAVASAMIYNLYANNDAFIRTEATLSETTIYGGDSVIMDTTSSFIQAIVNGRTVIDTNFHNLKTGVKIYFLDQNDNMLDGISLMGLSFEYQGINYYPNWDGTTRISLSERVANLSASIILNTNQNTIASGIYSIVIESFGSPDGLYHGMSPSHATQIEIEIVDILYGLSVETDDANYIINAITGLNLNRSNTLTYHLTYSSGLGNSNIRMSLSRRKYNEHFSLEYEPVDLRDFVTNNLEVTTPYVYMITRNPQPNMNQHLHLRPNLKTGTYKLHFHLYDNDTLVGNVFNYIIIK